MKSFHSNPTNSDISNIDNKTLILTRSVSRKDIIKGNFNNVETTYKFTDEDSFKDQLDALAGLFCQMFEEEEGD
ncbi:hypothetical protein [Faecalibacillus faecis]|uniref:hypothetical protein n=1 Tax=Faecalibacillus faecis TaxID=1982628 RepID=UPI0038701086